MRAVLGWLRRHEEMRRAVQIAVAVAIAFAAATALGLPEPSWAVFSALFVVQGSVGGTVTGAVNRIVGAAVGLAFGLLIIIVVGVGEWRSLVSLVLAVGVMAVIAGRWPQLQYGLVTVAILVVAPVHEVFEDSLLIAAEIAVGAVAAAATGTLVLPVAAHRSALRHLGQAVQACGRLLTASMEDRDAEAAPEVAALQEAVERELDAAREMMAQSRRTRPARHLPSQFELLRLVDRLWYTLAMANRLRGQRLPEDALRRMQEPLDRATEACAGYLESIGAGIAAAERFSPEPQRLEPVAKLVAAVDDLQHGDLVSAISHAEAEALFTMSFVWRQISSNIEDLAACVGGDNPG